MSDYLVEARPTLTRWLAGERIGPLPMRGAGQQRTTAPNAGLSFLRVGELKGFTERCPPWSHAGFFVSVPQKFVRFR